MLAMFQMMEQSEAVGRWLGEANVNISRKKCLKTVIVWPRTIL